MFKITRNKNVIRGISLLLLLAPMSAASSDTYVYDALGRLVKVTQDNSTVIDYQYDEAGNITNVDVSPTASAIVVVVPLNGFTVIPIN